jgi:SSS family solute:Na+ symporter
VTLSLLDWLVMLVYLAFVIGVGVALRRSTTTSVDFFQAGRAIPGAAMLLLSARSARD